MEKDTINYMQFKMGFSKKILLADETVSKKFQCQEDRSSRLCDPEYSRQVFAKRRRIDLLEGCEAESRLPSGNIEVSSFEDDNVVQEIIEPDEGIFLYIIRSYSNSFNELQQATLLKSNVYINSFHLETFQYY